MERKDEFEFANWGHELDRHPNRKPNRNLPATIRITVTSRITEGRFMGSGQRDNVAFATELSEGTERVGDEIRFEGLLRELCALRGKKSFGIASHLRGAVAVHAG